MEPKQVPVRVSNLRVVSLYYKFHIYTTGRSQKSNGIC